MKSKKYPRYLIYFLILSLPGFLSATVNERPFWMEKSSYLEGAYFYAVGVASKVGSPEEGREKAFENGKKEFLRFLQMDDLGDISIETQMTYEEPLSSGRLNVYRLLKVDYEVFEDLKKKEIKKAKKQTKLKTIYLNNKEKNDPVAETMATERKIAIMEDFLKRGEGRFNWKVHNELRHLYSNIDEEKALYHSDVILKNSLMDDYILKILSKWQLGKDPWKAKNNLLELTTTYPKMRFVRAAVWMAVGDLFAREDQRKRATEYYGKVKLDQFPGLERYRTLATNRLDLLPSE